MRRPELTDFIIASHRFAKMFIWFSLLSLFLTTGLIQAQPITRISNNLFEYKGETFKYAEMDHVFQQVNSAHESYLMSNKKMRTSEIWGYISIGGILSGFTGWLILKNTGLNDDLFITGIYLLGIGIIVAPIAGIVAIAKYTEGKNLKERSIDLFNQANVLLLPKQRQIQLSLMANNGIGFRISF